MKKLMIKASILHSALASGSDVRVARDVGWREKSVVNYCSILFLMEHNNSEGSLKVVVMLECNQPHQTQTGVSLRVMTSLSIAAFN